MVQIAIIKELKIDENALEDKQEKQVHHDKGDADSANKIIIWFRLHQLQTPQHYEVF